MNFQVIQSVIYYCVMPGNIFCRMLHFYAYIDRSKYAWNLKRIFICIYIYLMNFIRPYEKKNLKQRKWKNSFLQKRKYIPENVVKYIGKNSYVNIFYSKKYQTAIWFRQILKIFLSCIYLSFTILTTTKQQQKMKKKMFLFFAVYTIKSNKNALMHIWTKRKCRYSKKRTYYAHTKETKRQRRETEQFIRLNWLAPGLAISLSGVLSNRMRVYLLRIIKKIKVFVYNSHIVYRCTQSKRSNDWFWFWTKNIIFSIDYIYHFSISTQSA